MYLYTGLAEQPVLLHVAHQAASGAIRDLPNPVECVVAARLLGVCGSRGSEATAQENRSLNVPVIIHTVLHHGEEADLLNFVTDTVIAEQAVPEADQHRQSCLG